jgi:hypothetical protein
MTPESEILVPDDPMVLTTIHHSIAKKFVDDPVSTLQTLDHTKIQERFNYLMNENKAKDDSPPKE